MTTFVLVPGAWLGSWVWSEVAAGLEGRGHQVYLVTLSGLGGQGNVAVAEIGLGRHVADATAVIDGGDLRDVVLVGHSYAGIVVGQVAALLPERVRHVVFLDANLPEDGRSMTDSWSAKGQRLVRDQVDAKAGRWPAPEPGDFDGHDLTEEQANWLAANATGHPGRTLFEPAALVRPLGDLSATFVVCSKPANETPAEVAVLQEKSGWQVDRLDTEHWPMVSAPEATVELLHVIGTRS